MFYWSTALILSTFPARVSGNTGRCSCITARAKVVRPGSLGKPTSNTGMQVNRYPWRSGSIRGWRLRSHEELLSEVSYYDIGYRCSIV